MRISDLKYQILIFLFIIGLSCCDLPKEFMNDSPLLRPTTLDGPSKTLTGWWIYGEGQHIFKDELTLEEYDLIFPNENMVELAELYVSVCEMEYFPMESQMTGTVSSNIMSVQEFKILYIQGCGE